MHRQMKPTNASHGTRGRGQPRTGRIYIARMLPIALALTASGALANPEGPQVVHGSASFAQPNAQTLNVTNSHNAIINWQSFNIDHGQTTNFIQPGSNSAVLNRVMSNDPSKIYGNLNSNGKVFLINQHGLMIGAGAQINTAGFFGSTLNITDEDFLNGKLKFEGGGLGGIQNYGYIHAGPNGNVVLVAPDIENGGVIEVDHGNVILAAGESIRITSLNDAAIEFELQAPENGIINLGKIIANQGAARLFAGHLKHSGAINATGVVKNADGSISLVAQQDIEVAAGATLDADGDAGGEIRVQSHHGDVYFNGEASARGRSHHGGHIEILGDRVGLFGDAVADASGATGGGEVLIGGDFQGKGAVPSARHTQVGPQARIHADALDSGDGGKVIVWADETTIFSGTATATGGTLSGDGGFIEVSGKGNLGYYGSLDTTAAQGAAGTVLFDPIDVRFFAGGTTSLPLNPLDFSFNGALLTFDPNAVTELSNQGIAVEVRADRDITIDSAITAVASAAGGDITLRAGQSIIVNANITTDGGTLRLTANDPGASAANRGTGEAKLAMAPDTMIDAGAGNIEIEMAGSLAGTAGDITLGSLTGKHIILVHNGVDAGGDILQNTGGTITASSLFINHDFNTGGTVGTAAQPLNIKVDNFGAHIHGATPAPNGIHVKALPNSGAAVTIGGTCYGAGVVVGCDTFGPHFITGLEMVNGGGDIFLDVTGDLIIGDLVQISDPDATGNSGKLQLSVSGILNQNNTVRNNIDDVVLISGGTMNISGPVEAPAAASNITLDAGVGAPINLNSSLDAGGGTILAVGESVIAGLGIVKSNMSVANLQISGSTASLDNAGALQISNVFNFDGGTLLGAGSTRLLNGATLNLTGVLAPMTVDGQTLTLDAGSTGIYSASVNSFALDNGASLVNNGNFQLQSLGITSAGGGSITNGGTFTISPVAATVAVPFTNGNILELQSGASLTLPSGLTLANSSLLTGSGTVVANVTNNGGLLQPGGLVTIGTLTITGNYTQNSGTIEIEIQSTGTPGFAYDQLVVQGAASLLGNLSLKAINGYTVTANDAFTPITYTSVSNQALNIIPIGLETVTPTYNGTSLDLVLTFGTSMTWDGGAGTNNWNDALNWSLDFVPDTTFDVSISGATVNVSTVESVNSLSLTGNLNLNIGGSLTLVGGLAVAGGTLSVNGGSLAVGGTANFDTNYAQSSGSATFTGNAVFNGGYGHDNGTTIFTNRVDFNGPNKHLGGTTTFNGNSAFFGETLISGSSTLIFNGVGTLHNLNNTWSGGTITGAAGPNLVLGVSPGDTRLSIAGAAPKTLSTITLDMNRNDIVMSGIGSLNFVNATIDNTNGTSFDHSDTGSFLGTGTFDNTNGHFNKLSGSLFIPSTINFINTAGSQVNVAAGSLAFEAAGTDPASYNVGSAGALLFPNGRTLTAAGTLNLQGALLAGTSLTLPGTFNSSGHLVLNNATLNLANLGGTLTLANGASLGGTGTVAGNVVNSSGVLVVGGAGAIGNLAINGNYGQGAGSAMVIDVFNNGLTTVSDVLFVSGAANLDGLLVIGFTTNSLGLVTANFKPFMFGSVSGGFSRVIDAAGNILQLDFSAGEFTILGTSPKVPDKVIDDLIKFAAESEELADEVADNRSEAEAAAEAMLEEARDSGELVCR